MTEEKKEAAMKVLKFNRIVKFGYRIAVPMLFLFTFVVLTAAPSWACKGLTQSGYQVTMKMLNPNTGELFASITFDNVKKAGITEMAKSEDILPSPSRFKLDHPARYFDIISAADYSGAVKVCLNYKAIGYSDASGLMVSHFTDNSWVKLNTTLDREKKIVCGTASSLSPFAIFKDSRLIYGPAAWYQHSHGGR
jgi:hypothetical protein